MEVEELFRQHTGLEPQSATRLTPAGSSREYYRITAQGTTLIGVKGTNPQENAAFFAIDRQLSKAGIAVPDILAISEDQMCYLLNDLGDTSLFASLENARATRKYTVSDIGMLERVMRTLPTIQFKGAQGMDFSVCHPSSSFDSRSIFWDLNYFKYCFLKTIGLEFDEDRLENDFTRLTSILLEKSQDETFMYRDFQSRNIMVVNGEPYFIDFQGGRRGPVEYDVASFLWQARAQYPERLKEHLTNVYIKALSEYRQVNPAEFKARLRVFVLFRTLQVLGAYGYRGYIQHKELFLQSIPPAMETIRKTLSKGSDELPYLTELLLQMASMPQFSPEPEKKEEDKLTVRITSFSYRKGIPQDFTGNGGGFVFDCRCMHNPGRYDNYKKLTGADAPVKAFLESHGEVQSYLENVYGLICPAVEKYSKRGFTNLMACFGCTGGQHRSVYCANHLAAHLKQKFGDSIKIILEHREQNIKREL